MAQVDAVLVGKWSVAYAHGQNMHLLMFQFTDRPPINLAINPEEAVMLATAILEQRGKSSSH